MVPAKEKDPGVLGCPDAQEGPAKEVSSQILKSQRGSYLVLSSLRVKTRNVDCRTEGNY